MKCVIKKFVKLIDPYWEREISQRYNLEKHVRPAIQFIDRQQHKEPLIGAEIGVRRGLNSYNILKTLNMKMLYLIDPFLPYTQDSILITSPDYKYARRRLSHFNKNIKFIIKSSEEAVNNIPSNLDFVYIDGNHEYKFVKKDIELYYPKVRKGGIIGGDDYSFGHKGVIRAVDEFVNDNNLKLWYNDYKNSCDWWILKGRNK